MGNSFAEYSARYETVCLTRDEDGVLLVRLHSGGGPLVWGDVPHRELARVFHDIAADEGNRVVVLTGTGDRFLTDIDRESWGPEKNSPRTRDRVLHECALILQGLLAVPVPVIGAINGPARIHAELPLLSDLVVASSTTVFQDAVHFQAGGVPGDGVHVLWPMWLGPNRGRQFLLTGQEISAAEALALGLVADVVPPDRVLERAFLMAQDLLSRPQLTLRYSRQVLTLGLKRALNADLDAGLALEFLGRAWTRTE